MDRSHPLLRRMALAAAALPVFASAQPMLDITMADNGAGQLEVRVRPDGPYDGLVSNLTFTIRWPEAAGMALDTANALYPAADYMYPSATQVVSGLNGYLYRTFNAVSMVPMFEVGQAWTAGTEYPLCTIDILVPGTEFTLGNDAWTAANNRNYFCSLGGYNRTGIVFPSLAPVTDVRSDLDGGMLNVYLIPQGDFFGWVSQVDLTVSWPDDGTTYLGILEQPVELAGPVPVTKEGPETSAGGRKYQRFHGAGTMSLANAATGWTGGSDVLLFSIPVIGSATDVAVVNDTWTAANNGDYRILLNSTDATGAIDLNTAVLPVGSPTRFDVRAFATGNDLRVQAVVPEPADGLELSLHSLTGQRLWGQQQQAPGTVVDLRIDRAAWPAGIYLLQARTGGRTVTLRLVL